MKKLALALLCLVSVAFFASCDPTVEHPEPSIAIITGEDCVTGTIDNPQLISMTDLTNWRFGFHVESNAETNKELASLKVTYNYSYVDDETGEPTTSVYDTIVNLAGKTSYDYIDYVFDQAKEIILGVVVNATVTDADALVNTANIAYNIDMPDMPLETYDFLWNRHGAAAATGLAEFGLKWTRNGAKEDFAIIEPLEGAKLYQFQPEVWETVTTEMGKAALFSEMPFQIESFKGVSAWTGHDYDFVLGTTYQGENYLIHITKSVVSSFKGTDITITGQWK